MKWLLIILVVILFLPTMLMLRLLFKRLSLVCRLKAVCKSHGYRLIPTHVFWWMGWTKGKNSDFHVVTQDIVYSVKLIGTISKRICFNFVDENSYSLRNWMFQFSSTAFFIPYETKKKAPYQFYYKLPDECITKRMVPVILMNPISCMITVSEFGSNRKSVENGDYINEGYFFTGSGFLGKLREL